MSNRLGNLGHKAESKRHEELETLVGGMFDDFVKAENGNKAAATRVRVTLNKVSKKSKELRQYMLDLKNGVTVGPVD